MMSALYWVFAFEAALVPRLSTHVDSMPAIPPVDGQVSSVTFEAQGGVEIGKVDIFAWGSTRSTQVFESVDYYTPMLQRYDIGAGVSFGDFEIGFRHYCEHPIATFGDIITPVDSSRREIYARIEIDSRG
jgi:hypothetical protein